MKSLGKIFGRSMRDSAAVFDEFKRVFVLSVMIFTLMPAPVSADEAIAKPPCENRYGFMPYDDKICKRSAGERSGLRGFQDRLKFIPLAEGVELTIGGEIRQRYEYTSNQGFGESLRNGDGAWLQRLTLHGDLRFGEHLRLVGEGYHTYEAGRANKPSHLSFRVLPPEDSFISQAVQQPLHLCMECIRRAVKPRNLKKNIKKIIKPSYLL